MTKKRTKKTPEASGESCMDCRWLRTQVSFDSGAHYTCVKHPMKSATDILWRRPCALFQPLH